MAKKRTLNANTLQADFWTALPIDECRARIIQLQRRGTAIEIHDGLLPDRKTKFSTFELIRFHQITYWRRLVVRSCRRYRLVIAGKLDATTDGTHVSLSFAPEPRTTLKNLRLKAGLSTALSGLMAGLVLSGATSVLIIWAAIFGLFACEWWSKYFALKATVPTVLAEIHDELYVPHYTPDHETAADSLD